MSEIFPNRVSLWSRLRWHHKALFVLVALVAITQWSDWRGSGDRYVPPESTREAFELDQAGHTEEAFEIYIEDAEAGDRFAQFAVADMYRRGEGTEKDLESSRYWMRKSAEQGWQTAQYWMGKLYFEGDEVEQDFEVALSWTRKAEEQDDDNALFSMGIAYEKGQGVDVDLDKAINYYEESAMQGNSAALKNLMFLVDEYESDGWTSTATSIHRYKWFYVYRELIGTEVAESRIEHFNDTMPWWDVRRARVRAEWWLWRHGQEFDDRDSRGES